MPRIKVMINNANAKEIYQYFAKALHEKRIFEDDLEKLAEAQHAFLQIPSTHDVDIISVAFKASLQEWIDVYVSQSKWQRCLATLRQIRSNHRHEVKSIKLSKETYALLKNYADCLQLSIPQAIHGAIEPLVRDLQPEETSTALDPELSSQHEIKVKLWLNVENNSKFVRGKGKVLKEIEAFLEDYDAKKSEPDGWEYILTIEYDDEADLDEIIYEICGEMESIANLRHCFIEADVRTLDGKRSW